MITLKYCKTFITAAIVFCMAAGSILPANAADIEGKTATAVTVTGTNKIAENIVMGVVKVRPGDTLTADKIKEDMQAIYDLGYFFDVVANFTEVPEGMQVIYTVMENPGLSDIVVKGNEKVTSEKIAELVTTGKDDGILNTRTLDSNVRAIERHYHDQGYILAKVSDVSMTPDGVLTLTINEGLLEDIVVKGNEKTKTRVITREMKVKTGEAFNARDARRSMQKVYNLGYFEDVNMKLNPGQEPNAVVLEASVVEQKTGTFSIGGGYSKADGMIGIIEVGDNNFKGTGDKIKLHWEFGGTSDRNWEVSYTRPWLDSKQTSLGFSVYDITNEYNKYKNSHRISTYDKKRKGVELTLGRPSGEYIHNYITLKNRKDEYVEHVSGTDLTNSPDYPNYLEDNFGLTRSITLTRVFDSRDNVFNATEGARYSLSAEFAGRAFGGDFDFNKYTAEGRRYFKVGRDHVIASRLSLGYADGDMPETGRFSVGGSDTLRGYEDDEFEGNKMLTASVEYRFPVVSKVQGVVFSDIGNAWDGEGYKLDDLKYSVGVGIRLTTPIGPVRIDYAQGEDGGRTHFSFGGQF